MNAGCCPAKVAEPKQPEHAVILEHLDLVKSVAGHVVATLPKHVELDDLIQAGTIGLIDAAEKFNASKGVPFSIYAKHRIRGAILDHLRQQDPISRDLRDQQRKIEAKTAQLEQQLQRDVTDSEVADALNMGLDRLRTIRVHLASSGQVSASLSPNEDMPDPEFADSPKQWPEAIYGRKQLAGLLREAVAALPERQQKLIHLYYIDEVPMKEIGVLLNVNESRVSQIHKSAVRSLGEHLRAFGVRSACA